MNHPNQRGGLALLPFMPYSVDERAPKDYWLLFPAGNKASRPGSALKSQIYAAGPRGWTPYNPYSPSLQWRYGVCGDRLGGPQHHLRGGMFYHRGRIVASYTQGDVLGVGMSIVTHHNGFVEMHVCDVSRCGGEISRECFLKGACVQLKRAYHPECESGKSPHCGPTDRRYPGRWYLPCRSGASWDDFRPHYATFRLPKHFHCQHCVLQWYWVTANTCNPPGMLDYFDGPNRPHWGTCSGQGGARGGVSRNKPPCGRYNFPEEYVQCADIRIDSVSRARSAQQGDGGPSPSPTPLPRKHIAKLVLWADGSQSRELVTGSEINIGMYKRVGVEAIPVAGSTVTSVVFYMDNRRVNRDYAAPFFLEGSNRGTWLYNVPIGRYIRFAAKANGEWVHADVKFFK
ncbi:Lytic polysaccharide mono-oxygenase [Gracilaria domingensis]|nr:Lytic polysaccharide mono-oxygenase [Gracilaria domingensis]